MRSIANSKSYDYSYIGKTLLENITVSSLLKMSFILNQRRV